MSASNAGSNGGSRPVRYEPVIGGMARVRPTNVANHHREGGRP